MELPGCVPPRGRRHRPGDAFGRRELPHAVELLREDSPLATNTRPGVQRSTVPKLPAPVERSADDHALLQQVVSFYQKGASNTRLRRGTRLLHR